MSTVVGVPQVHAYGNRPEKQCSWIFPWEGRALASPHLHLVRNVPFLTVQLASGSGQEC